MLVLQAHAQTGGTPVIAVQPLDVVVPIGGSVDFAVVALSGTTLSYQWRKDGIDINGAKKSTYTIHTAKAADAGRYSVEVKNAAGAVVSSNALLEVVSVDVPLTFTSAAMTTNGFKMQLSGPSGFNYVILASSNLANWTPISTNAAPSGVANFTDTSATSAKARFYRALVQ
jgi:hypothetical protein